MSDQSKNPAPQFGADLLLLGVFPDEFLREARQVLELASACGGLTEKGSMVLEVLRQGKPLPDELLLEVEHHFVDCSIEQMTRRLAAVARADTGAAKPSSG